MDYTFTTFNENRLEEEINIHCKAFITNNITINEYSINIPIYLKTYSADFGVNEIETIKTLLKMHNDPAIKISTIVNKINKNDIAVFYY